MFVQGGMWLMNRSLKLRIFVVFFCLFGSFSAVFAQDLGAITLAERSAAQLRQTLSDAAANIQLPNSSAEVLTDLRANIEKARSRAFTEADKLKGPAAEISVRLQQLGPEPATGTTEAPGIAQERQSLKDAQAKFDAAQKTLELLGVEAEQLSARAASLQRDRFFQRVFESDRSVLNPSLWGDGVSAMLLFGQRFLALVLGWWGAAVIQAGLAGIAALLFFTITVTTASLLTRGWILRHLEPPPSAKAPSNFDRLWRVAKRTIINTAVALAAMVLVVVTLDASGVMTDRFSRVVRAILDAWLIFVVLKSFTTSILAPNLPEWRLPQLSDEAAARLSRISIFAALVFALDMLMRQMFDVLFLPLQFSVAHSAIVAGTLSFLLAAALRVARSEEALEAKRTEARTRSIYFRWTGPLLQVLWILLFVVIAALVLGYVALAHFITTQIISTGAMVSAFYLVHHLADELILTGLRRNSPVGQFLRRSMSLSESGVERLGVIFGTIVDLALVFIGVPLVFLQWVVTWVDLRSWLTTAFFGFELGGVTLSPSLLFLGFAVLFAGIGLTKLFTSWLDKRVLARTEMDKGVRNSVRKGVGYSGYLIAALVALTSAGVDFTSVALIAGALGVGIGFGLQSIVNNFVSGLILLAERPVKIGDWIVLAPGEGFVKRINVRATEIETFDGASIIVPNSSLISEPVKNWTHGDTRGKFVIPVNVARSEDPEHVRAVLISCVKASSGVSSDPEPWVLLSKFGDFSMEMQLNFFVEDVVMGVFIASDVRFAIVKAFREQGIVMPFPQRDVHHRVHDEDMLPAKLVRGPAARRKPVPKKKPRKR
jgi:potassium-dependent mechanosensitive channel